MERMKITSVIQSCEHLVTWAAADSVNLIRMNAWRNRIWVMLTEQRTLSIERKLWKGFEHDG